MSTTPSETALQPAERVKEHPSQPNSLGSQVGLEHSLPKAQADNLENNASDDTNNRAGTSPPTSPRKKFSLYYGWIMLPLAIGTLVASSPGQTFGISIFNEPLRLSLGLSHSQLAFAYMLGTLLGAIPITWIGRQIDRFGLRKTSLVIISLFSLSCLLTALVSNWWTLVPAFLLLRMLGAGSLSLISSSTLPFWFMRRLGTVEGMRQMGMAIAMTTIPAINLWLVTHWGWRISYAILGCSIWLGLFPMVFFFFRNRPEEVGQLIDGRSKRLDFDRNPQPDRSEPDADPVLTQPPEESWGIELSAALKQTTFWVAASGACLFAFIHTALFFNVVPILSERGLTEVDGAKLMTAFAFSLIFMQLLGGMMADRFRSSNLLCAGLVLFSAACWLIWYADSTWMAIVAGLVMGVAQGIYFGANHPIWARYFGLRHLGSIRGMLMTLNVATSSLGPLTAGLLRDLNGNFDLAMGLFILAPLPFAAWSLRLGLPPNHPLGTNRSGRDPECSF